MTIKEAFEKLTATCSAGMKNPFFIMRNLHDAFADIADKIVDGGGSSAEDISYDNSDSGLNADKVQSAIDELADDLGKVVSPISYSTTEQKTGLKWTDGKDIYQKTVHITALPSTPYTETSYSHGITNLDTFIKYEATAHWASGSATMLPYFAMSSNSIDDSSAIACYIGTANIQITVGKDRHDMDADVTIFYTKSS